VKKLRNFIFIVIAIIILFWVALGPGMRVWLGSQSQSIIGQIEARSDDHVKIGTIGGDFWSGIRLGRVIIYADKDPQHLPLLRADTVILKFSLANLLRRNFMPVSVDVRGFDAVLHISPDGTLILPEWEFRTAMSQTRPLHAGFTLSTGKSDSVLITCSDGILEIHKKFPEIPEMVDIVFTQLAGSGEYKIDEGLNVEEITGMYLITPIEVSGYVPADKSEPLDIDATIGDVRLDSIFRDLDPLFRDNEYLPDGNAEGEIHLDGPGDHPAITAHVKLTDASLGNINIDMAETSVAYSAGVVDLTGMTAQAYDGTMTGSGRINLLSETPLWTAICNFDSLDLPQYLEENGYLRYAMSGQFSGTVDARGDFSNADSLDCDVQIRSQNGQFLTPFSPRLLSSVQGAPLPAEITDEDMADFDDIDVRARIRNSRIVIQRFHFVSNDLQVEAGGSIGFDKTISADGGLSVPADLARQHPNFGRFARMLPDSINRVSLEFSITGTIGSPQFNPKLTENLLRGLTDQGSDLGHDLLGSISGNNGN
jgi:hypothetical protein